MDKVTLHINKQEIEDFESYRVESDLFVADDAFELVLPNRNINARGGDEVRLFVNGQLELTGIVDVRTLSYNKQGTKLTLKGRSLMGLLTDFYVEEFPTRLDSTLAGLVNFLLHDVPFINRSKVMYGKGDKSRAVPLSETEEDYDYQELDPGKTVFDLINEYALARGKLFFDLPDGTFVIGQPQTNGKAVFSLVNKRNDPNSNILEGGETDDLSRRYSKITVIGQSQGTDTYGADDLNYKGIVEDPDFPYYKPLMVEALYDGQNPQKYAQLLMDKYRFEGYNLAYKVQGHSQRGRNYAVNAICHVEDDELEIKGDYLIYSRIFERDKQSGSTTTLKLSKLGILPA